MKTNYDNKNVKKGLTVLALVLCSGFISAQKPYDNFEGSSNVCYNVTKGGTIDTLAQNPAPDKVNGSSTCAKYTRNGKEKFDNLKMCTKGKLASVSKFASYSGTPEKIKMKVYTTAPVGTLIEIQLGKKDGPAYPDGIHSQYQALTTVTGKWEELEFKFAQIPQGSKTSIEEVDQLTLLFNPNTNTNYVFYFDDITGPEVVAAPAPAKSENPAPANQKTTSPSKTASPSKTKTAGNK